TEAGDRLPAVLGAEPLDGVPATLLRASLEPARFRAAIVRDRERVERSWDRAPGSDVARLRLHAVERGRVLAHELLRPGRAREIGRDPALAESDAPRAVAVNVPAAMFRQAASRL